MEPIDFKVLSFGKCFLLATLFLLLIARPSEAQTFHPVIDARHWQQDERLLPVSGKFTLFENQLLEPDECKTAHGTVHEFPYMLSGTRKEPGLGYATYYIQLAVPVKERRLAITLPQIYSCYKLWINDDLVTQTGVVGKTREATRPQWLPKVVEFENTRDTLTIVMQIANFHHAKAGVKESVYLGSEENALDRKRISTVAILSETVILFLIGFLFLVVFAFSERKRVAFYFSMLCLTWAVRSMFSNQYLFVQYFPDTSWNLVLRVEYITLFLTIIWGTLTVSNLFRSEANVIAKYALVISNLLFIIGALVTTPRLFTMGLTIYLVFGALLLAYAAFVIVRAWINDRVGASILSISIFIAVFIFGYDILVFELFTSYNPIVFSLGYISIFTLIGTALALHINLIRSSTANPGQLTYEDMFKKP